MSINAPSSLVIFNANIYTLDPEMPHAQAMAAANGRIVAIGSDADILAIAARKIPDAPVLDLDGKTVLPGFIDCHTHFLAGGFSLQAVKLSGLSGPGEFVSRIAEQARHTEPGRWITGGGWDQETWPGAPLRRPNERR